MCNKHYTTSVKTRFTFVFYTDSYIRGINHILTRKCFMPGSTKTSLTYFRHGNTSYGNTE